MDTEKTPHSPEDLSAAEPCPASSVPDDLNVPAETQPSEPDCAECETDGRAASVDAEGTVPDDAEDTEDSGTAETPLIRRKDGLLSVTLLGAILGMLVGTIPATAAAYLFGQTFALPFVAIPLCIYGGITLLKGCRDRRAIIVTVIFSAIGAYLTLLGVIAAEYVASYGLSVFSIPLVSILYIGRENIFSGMTASSVYILIFLILGCYMAAEFFLGFRAKNKK